MLLTIIGISDNSFCTVKNDRIENATIYYGSSASFEKCSKLYGKTFQQEKCRPIVPLSELLCDIKEITATVPIVVFTSGDPNFFGLAKRLRKEFPQMYIEVLPSLSFMQIAFAKIGLSWEDALLESMHGRNFDVLLKKISQHKKICCFTDKTNNPAIFAKELQKYYGVEFCNELRFHLCQNLYEKNENISTYTISELIEIPTWNDPNVLIIENKNTMYMDDEWIYFGAEEKDISHSRGLITKNEVRSCSIHALKPAKGDIIWDVGAGSGSVSIELSTISGDIFVYAIEKKAVEIKNIIKNKNEFNVHNLRIFQGKLQEVVDKLPDPNKIFIGGTGGELENIINICCKKLKPGGILVINCVLPANAESAPEILYKNGMKIDIRTVSVTRNTYPQTEEIVFNKIHIIRGIKSGRDDDK